MENGKKNNQHTQKKQPKSATAKARKAVRQNKAKVLSVAVALAVSSHLTACSSANDASYYRQKGSGYAAASSSSSQISNGHGVYAGGGHYYGSYYYGRGSSYRSGSWGSTTNASIGHSNTGGTTGGGTHVGG